MDSNYERLRKAVSILVGNGTLRERLANAFRDEFQYIDPGKFSEMSKAEFEIIRDELTKEEANGDLDAIDMSVNLLGDSQAEDYALEIVDIFDEVAKQQQ